MNNNRFGLASYSRSRRQPPAQPNNGPRRLHVAAVAAFIFVMFVVAQWIGAM